MEHKCNKWSTKESRTRILDINDIQMPTTAEDRRLTKTTEKEEIRVNSRLLGSTYVKRQSEQSVNSSKKRLHCLLSEKGTYLP